MKNMKIINCIGPLVDEQTFEPCLQVTMRIPLSLVDSKLLEQQQALTFFRAFQQALEEHQQKSQKSPFQSLMRKNNTGNGRKLDEHIKFKLD